jgi:hypothetical protein
LEVPNVVAELLPGIKNKTAKNAKEIKSRDEVKKFFMERLLKICDT